MLLWNFVVIIAVLWIIVSTSISSLNAKSAFQLIQLHSEASMYLIALMVLSYTFHNGGKKNE